MPGSGASGGIGAALIAFAGAKLVPRMQFIARFLDLDALLEGVDIVVTGEGMLDGQSVAGKVPCELARAAAERGIPTIALAGSLGDAVETVRDHGIEAYASILQQPCTLDDALRDAEALLERATERTARMLHVGMLLAKDDRVCDANWRLRTSGLRQKMIEAACV
jgi:glycerate kinase